MATLGPVSRDETVLRGLVRAGVDLFRLNLSHGTQEQHRETLRRVGFSDRDIWDISAVVGFFNMSNRVASATDMRPNRVYHGQAR